MSFKVLAECVDLRTGKRFLPGEEFSPAPDPQQAVRLVRAGCLPPEAMPAARDLIAERQRKADEEATARKKAEEDAAAEAQRKADEEEAARKKAEAARLLGDMTKAELEAEAARRGVDISGAGTKAQIIALLEEAAKD